MIIGITGLIGSGKSTLANILKSFGFKIIDADLIAHQVVKSPLVLRKLINTFGKDIITSNGNLRRRHLAEIAFATESSRRELNKIVHPYILKEIKKLIKAYQKQGKDMVIDAPLLLESELTTMVDFIIMAHASEKERIKRLIKKGYKKSEILSRQKRQLPYSVQKRKADYCLLNNKNEIALKEKLKKILKEKTVR